MQSNDNQTLRLYVQNSQFRQLAKRTIKALEASQLKAHVIQGKI